MAEKSRRNESIDELKAEIDRSRAQLARNLRGLRYDLDFPAKFRRSFRKQPRKNAAMKTQAAAASCAKPNWNGAKQENILKLVQLSTLISGQLKV